MSGRVVNVVFAGLGGQGVIKASDILADAALRAGQEGSGAAPERGAGPDP